MSYLDVSPMIASLRISPEELEIRNGWLRHIPSGHDFEFSKTGNVHIRAQCDCAMLAVQRDQALKLTEGYDEWHRLYWRPLMINREFAGHFTRSPVRQALINLTAWAHRKLLEGGHARRHEQGGAMEPAE